LYKGATIADENHRKTTSENLPQMYSKMYQMSLQIFPVSVLFIAQNYGRIKCRFCSLINLFSKINTQIINKLLHNTKIKKFTVVGL